MYYVYAPPGPINTWHSYVDRFRIARTNTVALRDPYVMENYIRCGFKHIRQLHYDYNKIAREPTIGCYVELSVEADVGTIPIDSPKARKLIKRHSYF
jgi:hypothetical protein